jgi:Beta-propeller repeat
MKSVTFRAGFIIIASAVFPAWSAVTTMTPAAQPTEHVSRLTTPSPVAKARAIKGYGKLPLSFEANRGQTDPRVKFLSRGAGYTLFLTGDEAVLSLAGTTQKSKHKGRMASVAPPFRAAHAGLKPGASAPTRPSPLSRDVLRMRLVGAAANARVTGADELPGKSNYFIGNDPRKWRTNVVNYAKVKYQGVYPGVDLVYYGNQRQLEYDFVVAPGADPKAIQLALVGEGSALPRAARARPYQIDANGDLVVQTAGGEVRFHKPVVYQPALSARDSELVDGRYVLRAGNQIGFEVPAYDHTRPLIIDPVLSYSTFLGGSGSDASPSIAIAVDSSGNAYVAAGTASVDFPVKSAEQPSYGGAGTNCTSGGADPCGDAFVAKFDPTLSGAASLVYSTYLGGSDADYAYGLAVDSSGYAYITGITESADFPTTSGAFQITPGGGQDNFVTKLDQTGSALVYSTYLGGSGNDGPQAIVVDASGDAFITGTTDSFDFPITKGAFQTALRGICGGSPISCDTNAFVTKLNPAGTDLVYSTYLGGSGVGWWEGEFGFGLAVDDSGNAAVTGWTASCDFPVTEGAFQTTLPTVTCPADPWTSRNESIFVSQLNSTGTALLYSTYFGGSGTEITPSLAVDSAGMIYIVGGTDSPDLPVTHGAFQTTYGGGSFCNLTRPWCYLGDAFVAKFNPTLSGAPSLVYSTYLGGSGDENGAGIAVDSAGNAYVAGQTNSTDFPTVQPLQSANGGGYDAFVAELNPSGSALIYSTYLGGTNDEAPDFVAVDSQGNAYVGGWTQSPHFPTTPSAYQPTYGGSGDLFVAKIAPADNTAAGTDVAIQPVNGVSLTFSGVTTSGTTAVTQSATGSAPPSGFSLGSPAIFFELSTTATFTGSIAVCFSYAGVTFPNGTPQLFHYENNNWVDVTTNPIDTIHQIVCGSVTSLSPFALFSALYVATVQQPINADGSSVFTAMRGVVPVKFNLAIAGTATCQLPPATISLTRTTGASLGSVDESTYLQASDTGSSFRADGCQYVYNLATSSLGVGKYLVNLSIDGIVVGSATFGLK